MEHSLYDAAITGNIGSLHEILEKYPSILQKFAVGCFNGPTPLHIATSKGQLHFVKELLAIEPELTAVLDPQLRSALHLASAKGHEEIVKVLVEAGPEMCLVRDRDGKTPLHVAALKGDINVLKELVRACPQAARVRVDRNETILHLCIKHNQLKSLEILLESIQGEEIVNAKDNDGHTILHLAILDRRFKITSHVLKYKTIDVNVQNASGRTAMDILFLLQARPDKNYENDKQDLDRIDDLLRQAKAKQAKDLDGDHWLKKNKNSLMVVASLIATMAFQAGVNPPGGVWQDNKNGHRAGEAIMAYNYQDSYPDFLRFNTIGFVASLSTILLINSGLKFKNKATLWILRVSMWLAITSTAITYAYSNVVVTPKKDRRSLSHTIVIAVIVWSSVVTLLLMCHTYHLVAIFVREERRRNIAITRIKNLRDRWPSLLRKQLSMRDGGANPPLPVTSAAN